MGMAPFSCGNSTNCTLTFSKSQGFGEVIFLYGVAGSEIGDGLGDFDDFEIGAGGEVELFGGRLEEALGRLAECAEGGNLAGGKGRVEGVLITVASVLTGGYLCYGIFYSIMLVRGI